MTQRGLSRRGFLARAGLGLAAPYVLTSGALGADGKSPASDRIIAGAIGVGGRGMGLLGMRHDPRCTIAAVCDVDEGRLKRAAQAVGKCDTCVDLRRILDRRDINAVMTATPDHWHAPITIMACQSGKDVYCEKPLCRTLLEGRKMVEAARRHGRVVQMGTQYRSIAKSRQACEWIRNGRLGTVRKVRMSHATNRTHAITPGGPVPAGFHYDLWLGPAPWSPYHPRRCHFNFRFWMDYGGGFITDNGAHMFSIVSWAMGTDATGPVTVEATGRDDPNNLYDTPVEMTVRYEFADPPFVLTWGQPGTGGLSLEFIGDGATLKGFWDFAVTRGEADLSPTRSGETRLYESNNHFGNWFDCIATRTRPACDVEIGHRVTSLAHLGNVAYLTGRKLRWDPVKECFPDDPEANRLVHEPYREPWRL